VDETRFESLLKERQVAVIHFSHHAVMGHKVTFPNDLLHAISSFKHETRSCCALYPRHEMDLPGSIGVIFSPKYSQLLSVSSCDSGSSHYAGREGSMGAAPEEDAILDSLNVPMGTYNEWRIRGAVPVGIFIANPMWILVKQESTLTVGEERITDIGCAPISLQAAQMAFPSWPIYTMGAEGIEQL
jgi:hypothetical protein